MDVDLLVISDYRTWFEFELITRASMYFSTMLPVINAVGRNHSASVMIVVLVRSLAHGPLRNYSYLLEERYIYANQKCLFA